MRLCTPDIMSQPMRWHAIVREKYTYLQVNEWVNVIAFQDTKPYWTLVAPSPHFSLYSFTPYSSLCKLRQIL